MLLPAHVLLLLLLGAPRTGLAQKSSRTESISRCCTDTAPSEARKSQLEEAPPLSKRGPSYLPGQGPASGEAEHRGQGEDKGKRPFPTGPRARPPPHLTLSLDVPTNIMNILFNIAKAKNLRAQAAANAHLMAQVGRK
ncbi:urocortin-3 [Pteropus alecto]|uniref:urocortin-3 n=1 Tax=Pteropus alecto TaxID=9402 RepID=UPI0003F10DAA|nr:urocortin-3 [Pteropus alecto]